MFSFAHLQYQILIFYLALAMASIFNDDIDYLSRILYGTKLSIM